MSSKKHQWLLTPTHGPVNTKLLSRSPLTSYASEPENTYFNTKYQSGSVLTHRRTRTHRKNKKHQHKHKQRQFIKVNNKNSLNFFVSELIKEDNKTQEKEIHCIGICKSYNFDEISNAFNNISNNDYIIFARYEDALHFKLKNTITNEHENTLENNLKSIVNDKDIFVFQNEGVIVFWNVNPRNRSTFINLLNEFQINYPIHELSELILPQTDSFDYMLGDEFEVENYEIRLSIVNCFDKQYISSWSEYLRENSMDNSYNFDINIDLNVKDQINDNKEQIDDIIDTDLIINWKAVSGVLMMQKLAISFSLAQSLKLTVFEIRIDENVSTNSDIPKQMALNGSIKLNSKEIYKRMGRLFIARSELNLRSDILDTPEHFYENDLFIKDYWKLREYLNIDKRVEIINSRFDLLHELFEIVMSQQETLHSVKLEWIVIWLIAVEILVGVIELVNGYIKDK
eukprot:533156_1